ADSLRAGLRDGDIVARFGGDEFVVLALGVGAPGEGARLAERLASGFARSRRTSGETELESEEPPLVVQWSTGVAGAGGGADLDDLLARADAALYERKAARLPRARQRGAGATKRPG